MYYTLPLSLPLIPPASINIAAALADIIIIIDPRIFMVGVAAAAASLAVLPHISIPCLVSLEGEIGRSLTFKAAANSKSSLHLGDTVERKGPNPLCPSPSPAWLPLNYGWSPFAMPSVLRCPLCLLN